MATPNQDIFFEILSLANGDEFVTGSYLIDPYKASDIDVVILPPEISPKEFGFTQSNKEYLVNRDHTLHSVWRKEDYNLIVVKDRKSFDLWKKATEIMQKDPQYYSSKRNRVQMFNSVKGIF